MAKYSNVCIYCGKNGGSNRTTNTPPTNSPSPISGTCPSSPDKKHKPRWKQIG